MCSLNVSWVTRGKMDLENKRRECGGVSERKRWETNGLKNKSKGSRGHVCVKRWEAAAFFFVLYGLERAAGIRLALWGRWPLCDQTLKLLCHPTKQTLCQACNFQSGFTLDSTYLPHSAHLYSFPVNHPHWLFIIFLFFLLRSASSCLHRLRWAQPWEESPATWERWTPLLLCLFGSVHLSVCLKGLHLVFREVRSPCPLCWGGTDSYFYSFVNFWNIFHIHHVLNVQII